MTVGGVVALREKLKVVKVKEAFEAAVSTSIPFDATFESVVKPAVKLNIVFAVPAVNALNRIVARDAEAPALEYFTPLEAT